MFSSCFSVGHVQQVRTDVGINNTTGSVLISKQDNKKKSFLGPFLDFRQRFSFNRSYHQSPSFACFVCLKDLFIYRLHYFSLKSSASQYKTALFFSFFFFKQQCFSDRNLPSVKQVQIRNILDTYQFYETHSI